MVKIHQDFDLICFGGQPFYEHELKIINDYNLSHQIKQINGSDDLLNSLYKGASSLAYLSTYEGFGFPVAQAMACGVPVVTSATSCLPEISGGGALHVDPKSPSEISNALERVLESGELQQVLGREGLKLAQERYRWEICAKKSWDFFTRAAG